MFNVSRIFGSPSAYTAHAAHSSENQRPMNKAIPGGVGALCAISWVWHHFVQKSAQSPKSLPVCLPEKSSSDVEGSRQILKPDLPIEVEPALQPLSGPQLLAVFVVSGILGFSIPLAVEKLHASIR